MNNALISDNLSLKIPFLGFIIENVFKLAGLIIYSYNIWLYDLLVFNFLLYKCLILKPHNKKPVFE